MKEEELKIKFPYVYKTLITKHDDDLEYCEELIQEEDEEGAKLELAEANEIRRFFEDNELTFDSIKQDLKEALVLNETPLPKLLEEDDN